MITQWNNCYEINAFIFVIINVFFFLVSRKQYGREIRDTNQPLLLHKPKKKKVPPGVSVCFLSEPCSVGFRVSFEWETKKEAPQYQLFSTILKSCQFNSSKRLWNVCLKWIIVKTTEKLSKLMFSFHLHWEISTNRC